MVITAIVVAAGLAMLQFCQSTVLARVGRFCLLTLLLWQVLRVVPTELFWRMPADPTRSQRRCGWGVLLIVLMFHLTAWVRLTWPVVDGYRDYLLTGDQPAYLYIAESIVRDRDLDVRYNHLPPGTYHDNNWKVKHAYSARFHNRTMDLASPEFEAIAKRIGDAQYSMHREGTAMLIAPFYYIGGLVGGWERRLVCLFLVIVAAAACREMALAACRLGVPARTAGIMAVTVGLVPPVACMSTAIYPEVFILYMVARLFRLSLSTDVTSLRRSAEFGVALAITPWLQDKYLLWILPFFAVEAFRVWRSPLRLLCLGIPAGIGAVSMIFRNSLLYGRILPRNPLGEFLAPMDALRSGIPGCWVDWGYGLFMLAPYAILFLAGLWVWMRDVRRSSAGIPLLAAATFSILAAWAIIGPWYSWFGGFAPPNRFMLTLVPIVAPLAMLATARLNEPVRSMACVFWVLSLALGLECINRPAFWYSASHPSPFVASTVGWDGFAVRFAGPPGVLPSSFAAQVAVVVILTAVAVGFAVAVHRGRVISDQ